MKIAIFSDTFAPQVNGVAKTLDKLKNYMDEKGIEYKFFIPGEASGYEPFNRIMSFSSMNFFLYPECKIALPRYVNVKEALDNFQPDLIHIATPFSIGLMGLKYARSHNIPLAASYHTNFIEYLKYYKLQFIENFLWNYFRWFHSFCHVNFCPSQDTFSKLKQKGIGNLKIWGRGIDTQKFSPKFYNEAVRKFYAPKNELVLLYVGRIAAEKELDVLLAAAELLNKKNLAFKLILVGDGPERREMEAKGIANVIFTGYKFNKELQEIYASSDIFVFPSSSETYGNVILEAMASGLPVVGAFAGGVKENLKNMYNGLAFNPGASQEMADKIERIIVDNELRKTLGKNARTYAATKSWSQVFVSLFNDYSTVIKKHKLNADSYYLSA